VSLMNAFYMWYAFKIVKNLKTVLASVIYPNPHNFG
jgi:hypothetical protein